MENNKKKKNSSLYEEARVYGTDRQKEKLGRTDDFKPASGLPSDQKTVIGFLIAGALIIIITLLTLVIRNGRDTGPVTTVTPLPSPSAEPSAAPDPIVIYGVVYSVDTDQKAITIYDVQAEEKRVLAYTGSSVFYNKFDALTTANTLSYGDLIMFTMNEDATVIVSGSRDKEVWEINRAEITAVNRDKQTITVKGANYKYSEKLCILSNDRRIELVDLLIGMDKFTVRGKGTDVYELIVTTGHGEIALSNFQDFLGGTIDIGPAYSLTIDEKATYTVPEGEYIVTVTKDKYKGTEVLQVNRDKTTVFDVYEYGKGPVQTSKVTFDITPVGAILYVNNQRVDYQSPVELEYGKVKVEIQAPGYTTQSQTITIDSPTHSFQFYLKLQPTPTPVPTDTPVPTPTVAPTDTPAPTPTAVPTLPPTIEPTLTPAPTPLILPTVAPGIEPTPSPEPAIRPVMPTEAPATE